MMAYYLGLEEETLIHSTTWMNFEDIMLMKEVHQKRKNTVRFHFRGA